MRSDMRTAILHVVAAVHYSKKWSLASICTCRCSKWSSLWTRRRHVICKRSNVTNRQGVGERSGSIKASFLRLFIIWGVAWCGCTRFFHIFIAIAHPVNFSVLPLKCYVALSGDHMVIKGEVTLNPEVIHRSHDALEATLMTQPDTRVSRSFVSAPPPFFFWCQLIQRDAGWDACYCVAARTQQGKYKIDSTIGWIP